MKKRLFVLIGFVFISFSIFLLRSHTNYVDESLHFYNKSKEQFNAQYTYVNSIDLALKLIELEYSSTENPVISTSDSFQFLLITKNFVKRSFYHGNAAYDWRENWICYLLGKTTWSHFNSVVSPYEVIVHSSAMCSQQTMVFTKLMSLKGYNYRYVYLLNSNSKFGHFCCEIWQGGSWHFVDVNGEPNWNAVPGRENRSIEEVVNKRELSKIYDSTIIDIRSLEQNIAISYSKVNEDLGRNMVRFQQTTKELSWILPLLIGTLFVLDGFYFSRKRAEKLNQIS